MAISIQSVIEGQSELVTTELNTSLQDVMVESPEDSSSVQEAPIDKSASFAINFHVVLFPPLQNFYQSSEQRLEHHPESVGAPL